MTTTFGTTPTTDPATDPASAGAGITEPARPRWPLWGLAGGVAAMASVIVSMQGVTEADAEKGTAVLSTLERGGYHAGFVLAMVSVACLFVAAQGWKRWAEERAPRDLAARTVSQGLAATATVNIVFASLMGSMSVYLPGGSDEGFLSTDAMFVNYTLLDFGVLLGWWGAAVAAIAVASMAFRRQRLLPRWMGVVSVVLLFPPMAAALGTGLPGMVGLTMPIWLAVISVGMVRSNQVTTPA